MSITDRKIAAWNSPISSEADRPQRTASDMKAVFDANSNQLKSALNGVIDDLAASTGAENIGVSIPGITGGTVRDVLATIDANKAPLAHKTRHSTGGEDAISPSDIGAAASDHDHDNSYAPLAHKSRHATGGDDPLSPSDIGAVAAEGGKGLSSNDYTADEKAKVALIKTDEGQERYLSGDGVYRVPPGGSSSGSSSINTYPITLTAAGWTAAASGYTQTVPIAMARPAATNCVSVEYADESQMWIYGIRPESKTTGYVTFHAEKLPAADVACVACVIDPSTIYVDTIAEAIAEHNANVAAHENIELDITGGANG